MTFVRILALTALGAWLSKQVHRLDPRHLSHPPEHSDLMTCNIEHAHDGPCGAEDCWWTRMIEALDRQPDHPVGDT